MPHSTRNTSLPRVPNFKFPVDTKMGLRTSMEKFPDMIETMDRQSPYALSPVPTNGYSNGAPQTDRWQPRRDSALRGSIRGNGSMSTGGRHNRQKSLSEAIRTVAARRGSVSANVHEIGDALKVPVSPTIIIFSIIWYMSSALTNTSSKAILNAFPKPATLTLIQFGFVSSYCLFFSWLAAMFPAIQRWIPSLRHKIRYPTRDVVKTTLPLAGFAIGGHLLSSAATTVIPVSLVHTIKGLSPLFTVMAYRFVYNIRYPIATYLSLIPLTLGVMLACSADLKLNIKGILYAFMAALIFVTQNIFSKRLFNEAAMAESSGVPSRKLDKLNLLFYSSGMAFLLTFPIWFYSEGTTLLADFYHDGAIDLVEGHALAPTLDHGRLALEFIFNGTFHFAQNIMAFILLSLVSPVTYSVASLLKRVFVVVVAIIWFQNPTTPIQGLGIAMTFFGLYLYDRTKSNKADNKASMLNTKQDALLPLTNSSATSTFDSSVRGYANGYGYALPVISDDKKSDDPGSRTGRSRGASSAAWLPPGTRQEETWRPRELSAHANRSSAMNGAGVSAI